MKKKDRVRRIRRHVGGDADWLLIERRQCTNEECGKTHRLLPGNLVLPYKHYDAGAIEDVIDGTLDEDALCEEQFPCETTLRRWRNWGAELVRNTEGQLRSTLYRVYDLADRFLEAEESLLKELKKRIGYGWLTVTVRIYIDTGGG